MIFLITKKRIKYVKTKINILKVVKIDIVEIELSYIFPGPLAVATIKEHTKSIKKTIKN